MLLVRSLIAWCWVVSIVGFGRRYLNFNNWFLKYANEAVLPFYMLHQTVILIIGFFIIQLRIGIGWQFVTIATTSFVTIMAIYELVVRRTYILRFFFGMRLKNGAGRNAPVSAAIRQVR
ncbi:hypothetical protein ACFLZM_05320 [Thermodesulfobacteriota bacterium]